jgi:ubiquinone/menaquinone biosynthesis C-methylase UbiE
MTPSHRDAVKREVAAHWNRRAPSFDDDFGHSVRTPAERAAWDRILNLVLGGRAELDALDVGCGTGFLTFELAARGHRVIGVDFAPAMIAEARRKAATYGVSIRLGEADAEQLPFHPGSFDLAISRHLLWTLPHPAAAIDEWMRVLRPGGRLVIVDAQFDVGALAASLDSARTSHEYEAIGDELPFLGGRPREEIEALLAAHGLMNVDGDPLLDLVAAQKQRIAEEGLEKRMLRRYAVWGNTPR